MNFRVRLTGAARRDLFGIYDYISDHDSPENAEYVLSRIEERLTALSELPDRGAGVPEIVRLGESHFREVFFKPYRIVYEVCDDELIVCVIADGRRNLNDILLDRLRR